MAKLRDSGRLVGGVGGINCSEVGEDVTFQETTFWTTSRDFVGF